jgi:acyl-CoA synthetase (AMP-forming)/AMP-acid ligase II
VNLRGRFEQELDSRHRDHPDGLAIQFKSHPLTNADLREALTLLRSMFTPLQGVRIVLLLPDCLEAYLLHLHFFLEGAVLIPISVQTVGSRIREICETVCADFVVTNEFLFRAHGEELSRNGACLVIKGAIDGSSHRLHVEWIGKSSGFIRAATKSQELRDQEPVRFIIFTSGSTGTPKGVCLSEENVLSAADMMVRFLPLDAATLSMVTVPIYDYYGMIQIFGHVLGKGAYIFGLNSGMPTHLLSTLAKVGCTDLVVVPHALRVLLDSGERSVRASFEKLKRVTSSSDMLTQDILEKLFQLSPHVEVVNIYGLTEAGRACSRKIVYDTPFSRAIGKPSHGVEIAIEGDGRGEGEIIIRGPNVMLGYLAKVKAGRVEFEAYQELRTGDLGYRAENGEIMLLGRRDHMINLMGMKIHPSEIEMAASSLGVVDARARVCECPGEGGRIHLDVVCTDPSITSERIISELRNRLPRPFVPRGVSFVKAIQRTELGSKIVR